MSGFLTTHVLDTARGCPAAGLKIDLYRINGDARVHVISLKTNSDGRTDQQILPASDFELGQYELVFHAGDYLVATEQSGPDPKFLDVIPIRFGMALDDHY